VVFSGPPAGLLRHFQVSGYAELYEKLEKDVFAAVPPATRPERTAVPSPVLEGIQLVKVQAPAENTPGPHIDFTTQVGAQALRGLHLILRDRPLLALLVGQPLLIGLLINLSQIKPDGLKPLFLFAVVTSVWLGLNNTAREVVRDRRVYQRERLLGVTPEGYLVAKTVLFGAVGLAQLCLLVVVLRCLSFLPPETEKDLAAWSPLFLVLVLWVAYLSAMFLGLLISTVVNSQEAAVAALPMIVLPQLLLTGVVTGLTADSSRNGSFDSLVLMMRKSGEEPSRGAKGWVLEVASLPTYTRPAMALLREPSVHDPVASRGVVALVDWLHALLLLAGTATLLVAVFRLRERRWLEQA
jgi:hypothetical protein